MAQKAGKYDAVLPNLRKFQEESTYQQKIDEVKRTIPAKNAIELADLYIQARRLKDALTEQTYLVQLKLTALEQLLDDSQERQAAGWGDYGVKENALRLASGATIRVHREPYGTVKDKEAFRLWCISNGYERQLQLWPSTMNAIVKERLLAGEAEPDGCESWSKLKVVYVKGDE